MLIRRGAVTKEVTQQVEGIDVQGTMRIKGMKQSSEVAQVKVQFYLFPPPIAHNSAIHQIVSLDYDLHPGLSLASDILK